jgi:hypothetical protein
MLQPAASPSILGLPFYPMGADRSIPASNKLKTIYDPGILGTPTSISITELSTFAIS